MQEQRRHFRKKVDWPVEIVDKEGRRTTGVCCDLSLGGMHIDTKAPAAFSSDVTIFLRLPGAPSPCKLPGVVRWTKPSAMGVQFGLLGASETYLITEALAQSSKH